ncbi:hypothetical protein EMCRGX_G016962 [Ephydatia muelleri]
MDTDKPSSLGRSINTFEPEEEELLGGGQRKTNPPRCWIGILTFSLVASMAVIVGLSIGLGVATNRATAGTTGTCLTEECVQLAALVLSRMDTSVNPCQNFYNFSCGRWMRDNIIPTGYSSYTNFAIRNDLNSVAIKKILEGSTDGEVEAIRKMRTLYQSCMDTTATESRGVEPLLHLISSTGGWSLLDGIPRNWSINGNGFLQDMVLGSKAFFKLTSRVDDKNPSRYILELMQSGLSLPAAELYNTPANGSNKAPEALKQFITTTLSLINSSLPSSNLSRVADDIIAFETKLAGIFVSKVELRDSTASYNLMSLSNLSQLCPVYDWIANVRTLLNSTAAITIDGSEPVVVTSLKYFLNLTQVINSADSYVLENYAKWHQILPYLQFLDSSFRTAMYAFSKVTSGDGEKDRYKFCISLVQDAMPIALALPYTNVLIPKETKPMITGMIGSVMASFKQRLDSNTWLDSATRTKCKEKVDAIVSMVAYPDGIFNTTYLNSIYSWLNVSGDKLFENVASFFKHDVSADFATLRKAVDKTQWQMAPTAVNAYYEPVSNQFVFLEGILNSPFFQVGWPLYYNYGSMGVIIGHELTHGFDDHGQQYDKDGQLRPWWTAKSQQNFNEKKLCYEKQYSGYEVFGFHINGNLTLGENIADNGGLVTSYQAYTNAIQGVVQQSLPGVPFTPEQLFFIGFSQVWCSLFTPEYIQKLVLTNPHSPGWYRVIGTLQNSEAFSKAFNCPANTFMNPSSKCDLW